MVVNLLTVEKVEVLCIQEVFGGDFPSLLQTTLSHTMAPGSHGREAGFLFRNSVSDSPFLELRMHCPCVGECLRTQCASVRSVRPTQV